MSDRKKIYFNPGQIECLTVGAHNNYIVASRGFGKSEGIDAPWMLRYLTSMPRSAGGLMSPTYAKLMQNTLPAIFSALDRWGYKRNIHYFVGRKPDKKLNWPKPIIDPISYDHVISWWNGSIQNMISFDRSMSANSMSLDYLMGFEAKYLDYSKITNEVLPANRGNRQHYGNYPWHHGQTYSTDMPTLKSGFWILDKAEQMDKELISCIKSLYSQMVDLKARKSQLDVVYNKKKLHALKKELAQFRSVATFYAEFNVLDNIDVLGEKWLADRKRENPPMIFRTAYLNQRPRSVENGFYPALSEKLHYYESSNVSYLQSLDYNMELLAKEDCRRDADVDPSKPLVLAFDYNAAINNLVTGQRIDNELRCLRSMFVKTPRKLTDLTNDWCDYYHYHPKREVVFVYDSTAVWDTPLDAESFKDTVIKVLIKRGWTVHELYIGQPMKHHVKHNIIHQALCGSSEYLLPTFNKHNCEYLLMAMENTGILVGRNGFEKDKRAEKETDSPDNPDELKTHVTDAWDTFFIGCQLYWHMVSSHAGLTSYISV